MFVQIIRGTAIDAGALRAQLEAWERDVRPGAEAFLGATGGITGAGTFLLVLRFGSEEAARASAARAEYAEWWATTQDALGDADVAWSGDVTVLKPGSDDAGFVQMMQASVKDRVRFEEIEREIADGFMRLRPDVLGASRIWLPGPRVHVVDYFTSEADARAGEKKEMPDDLRERFGAWMAELEDVRWHDITEPWLIGPA